VEGLDGDSLVERRFRWALLFAWLVFVAERGELGFDVGQVPLGVSERLRVAERLADSLGGVGDGLIGGGEVVAGVVEQSGDARDSVLDALDEPDAALRAASPGGW
jgi:hypothetical protein